MLWVHVPYTKHKNDLVSIQEEICSQYHYDYDDYFNAYQNKKINYIVKVKNKKKTMYISKKEVKNAFVQKYQVNPTKVEIGYENDQFVYCLTYKGKDTLLYAFYSLDNGEFLKAYKL